MELSRSSECVSSYAAVEVTDSAHRLLVFIPGGLLMATTFQRGSNVQVFFAGCNAPNLSSLRYWGNYG